MSHLTVWSNYVTFCWLSSKLVYIEQEIQSITYTDNIPTQTSHINSILFMKCQLLLALFALIFK
jgi:hypothetical protein